MRLKTCQKIVTYMSEEVLEVQAPQRPRVRCRPAANGAGTGGLATGRSVT